MCSGPLYVDSFSAFQFFRNYNRLPAPSDASPYHNLAIAKGFDRNNSIIPSKILAQNPLQMTLGSNRLVLDPHRISNGSSSPNRTTVSSTCSPTPSSNNFQKNDLFSGLTEIPIINSPIDGNSDMNGLQSQDPKSSSRIKNTMISTGLPTIEHFQCILSRRQRGEKRPIPEEQKDEKYFERRKRNNEAAKKSRDARKMREDRIALRAALLEQENAILKAQIYALREELLALQQMICNRANIQI